jgi:hypothetical protein
MAPVLTREIRESDVATVVRMVHDLAAYEDSAGECRLNFSTWTGTHGVYGEDM